MFGCFSYPNLSPPAPASVSIGVTLDALPDGEGSTLMGEQWSLLMDTGVMLARECAAGLTDDRVVGTELN